MAQRGKNVNMRMRNFKLYGRERWNLHGDRNGEDGIYIFIHRVLRKMTIIREQIMRKNGTTFIKNRGICW